MKLKPLGDRIVVQQLEAQEMTAGGIVLPDSAKEKPKEGKIIALGEGRLNKDGSRAAFQVKKGDLVLFSSYAGTEVEVDGKKYLIMSEDDVLAVIG